MNERVKSLRTRLMAMGLFSVIIVVAVIFIIALYAQDHLKDTSGEGNGAPDNLNIPQANVTQIEQFDANGSMGLRVKGDSSTIRRNQEFIVIVYADSKGEDILTYDAYIRYNNKDFEYVDAVSQIEGVQTLPTDDVVDEGDFSDLIISGDKTTKKGPMILSNTALVEITFRALKAGRFTMEPYFELGGGTDSNLFNSKTQDILGKITGVDITVQ